MRILRTASSLTSKNIEMCRFRGSSPEPIINPGGVKSRKALLCSLEMVRNNYGHHRLSQDPRPSKTEGLDNQQPLRGSGTVRPKQFGVLAEQEMIGHAGDVVADDAK